MLLLFSCSVMFDSFAIPWAVACQTSLSMGFSRQKYWSWLPFPSPVDLLSLGIEPRSPALQADFYRLSHLSLSKVTTILPSRYYYFCLFELYMKGIIPFVLFWVQSFIKAFGLRFIPVVACSMLVIFSANRVPCVIVPQFSYVFYS